MLISKMLIQNQMEKPVGFLSREPRATLTSGLANTRHPSTTGTWQQFSKSIWGVGGDACGQ